MANDTVRTSQRDWATECAIARAAYVLDTAEAGVVAVLSLQQPVVYEFSGGREFRDSGRKPGT